MVQTEKQIANNWWNQLSGGQRLEFMKKHGGKEQGSKPWIYRAITDKGILRIFKAENNQSA